MFNHIPLSPFLKPFLWKWRVGTASRLYRTPGNNFPGAAMELM